MHSKYWIWVSEGKRSKSWKWPAPFFQEGLAQTGLFQSFRTELLLYDERTLSLKCNHLENTVVIVAIRCPLLFLTLHKEPSFLQRLKVRWTAEHPPRLPSRFRLHGKPALPGLRPAKHFKPWAQRGEDTPLPWVLLPFPQLCSQPCSFYRPDRNGIQHIHWSWKRLYSSVLHGLDGERIKISYVTGCPSLFRLL